MTVIFLRNLTYYSKGCIYLTNITNICMLIYDQVIISELQYNFIHQKDISHSTEGIYKSVIQRKTSLTGICVFYRIALSTFILTYMNQKEMLLQRKIIIITSSQYAYASKCVYHITTIQSNKKPLKKKHKKKVE